MHAPSSNLPRKIHALRLSLQVQKTLNRSFSIHFSETFHEMHILTITYVLGVNAINSAHIMKQSLLTHEYFYETPIISKIFKQ